MADFTRQIISGRAAASGSTARTIPLFGGQPTSYTGVMYSEGIVSTPGIIKNLRVEVATAPGTGKHWDITLLKNGVGTLLTLEIANSATTGSNLTDEITVVAGDTLTLQLAPNGTPPQGDITYTLDFIPTTTGETLLLAYSGAPTQNQFGSIIGGISSATEFDTQLLIPCPGTIQNLYIKSYSAAGSGKTLIYTVRKNGVDQSLAVTLSGASQKTGNDIDIGHAISVVAGDKISIKRTGDSTVTNAYLNTGLTFVPTTSGNFIISYLHGANVLTNNSTQYNGVNDYESWGTTETSLDQLFPAYTLKNMYVELSVAPDNGAGTQAFIFTLRKNSASQALTVTISETATTGNATADVTIATDDKLDTMKTLTGTPVASVKAQISYTGYLAPAAATRDKNIYSNTYIKILGILKDIVSDLKVVTSHSHQTITSDSKITGRKLLTSNARIFPNTISLTRQIIGGDGDINFHYNNLVAGGGSSSGSDGLASTTGILKNLRVEMATTPPGGNYYDVTLYKNGVATLLTVHFDPGDTIKTNLVNEISIVAGDRLSLYGSRSSSGNVRFTYTTDFIPTIPGETLLTSFPGTLANNSFASVISSGNSATEFDAQMIVPCAGTIQNLYVNSGYDAGANTMILTVRKNGVNTPLAVTLTGTNKTGYNISDGFTVVPGDKICIQRTGTYTSASILKFGLTFVPEIMGNFILGALKNTDSGYTVEYLRVNSFPTNRPWIETSADQIFAACTLKNMYVEMSSPPNVSSSYIFTLRKNAASQALTVTITGPSATTGNATSDVSIADNDLLDTMQTQTGTGLSYPLPYQIISYTGYVAPTAVTRTKTILSDAYIKIVGILKTILSDAIAVLRQTKTITSDATILQRPQKTILSNAAIKTINIQKTRFSDATIKIAGIQETIPSDTEILHRSLKTIPSDTTIKVTEIQKDITSDAIVFTSRREYLLSDATIIIKNIQKELDSDAIIKTTNIQEEIPSDTNIIAFGTQKNILSDTNIIAFGIQKNIVSDAHITYHWHYYLNSDTSIKVLGTQQTILSDAKIVYLALYHINAKINTIKQVLSNITSKFSLAKRVINDIKNYISTAKGKIYDVNNKVNTQGRKIYDITNDVRFIKSWQKAGPLGFQSLGKSYIKVYIATVEQTDVDVDSINIRKQINSAHTASFDLGRTYDNATVPVLEAVVEIKYKDWVLYKGYVTSVVPSDSPESITINCQDEYWKQNQTNKYFFVGHNPNDNREKYYLLIKEALLAEIGWGLEIGQFVPEIIDCFGQGKSDTTTTLIEQCGNFGWWYDVDGTKKLWEGGRGSQINIQRQEIGKNIDIYQLIEHRITTTSENVINRYRVQMGTKTSRPDQGSRSMEVYTCSNFEGFTTPAWNRSLEHLAKKGTSNGYGFNYTGIDNADLYKDVFRKYYIPDLDPETASWTDRYPPRVEVYNPGGWGGSIYGFPMAGGRIYDGFTIDYENRTITFNEPKFLTYTDNYGNVTAIRAPILKVYLWKEHYATYTASETEDPETTISNPYMFFRDASGFVPTPTYPTVITKLLNLTGLTYVADEITWIDDRGIKHTIRAFDDTPFAKDYTDWQLSNTCDAKINGTFTLVLDALCFNNIDLSKRIYIKGITSTPLNITSINYNMSNFTVSIEVENKRYFKRTASKQRFS